MVQAPLSINFPFSLENPMISCHDHCDHSQECDPEQWPCSGSRLKRQVGSGSLCWWHLDQTWELDWGQRSKNGPVHGNSMDFSKKEWSLPFGKIT